MEQVRAREAEGSPASADVMNNVKDVQGSQACQPPESSTDSCSVGTGFCCIQYIRGLSSAGHASVFSTFALKQAQSDLRHLTDYRSLSGLKNRSIFSKIPA